MDVPDERDDYFEVEEVKETQKPGVFKQIQMQEALSPEKALELQEQLQSHEPTPDSDEDDYDKYLDQIEQKAATSE